MKKMIKSLAIAAAMLLTTSVIADTSYLYWMSDGLGSFKGDWSYAKVAYNGGTTGTGYLGVSGSNQFYKNQLFVDGNFRSMQVLIGSTMLSDSYKFALELFDGDQSVGISQWLAYSPDFIGDQSMTSSSYAQFGFQIPEPTSGLLMMMGFGLLALRRKQKKA